MTPDISFPTPHPLSILSKMSFVYLLPSILPAPTSLPELAVVPGSHLALFPSIVCTPEASPHTALYVPPLLNFLQGLLISLNKPTNQTQKKQGPCWPRQPLRDLEPSRPASLHFRSQTFQIPLRQDLFCLENSSLLTVHSHLASRSWRKSYFH